MRADLGLQLLGLGEFARGLQQRNAAGAGEVVDLAHRRLADAALGRVDDALEGEIVGRLAHDAEIGHRVADLEPLVEARAADDAVVEAERDEAVFELAHLERGAHQDGDVVEAVALALQRLDLLADGAGFLVESQAAATMTLAASGSFALGEQRLAEPAFIVGDEVRGGAENVAGGAVVALQPDHLGAGKILLEAQDVVDLRAAPAIDRLVVVADAADVRRSVLAHARSLRASAPRGRSARPVASFGCLVARAHASASAAGCVRDSRRSHRYCAMLVSWYSSTSM